MTRIGLIRHFKTTTSKMTMQHRHSTSRACRLIWVSSVDRASPSSSPSRFVCHKLSVAPDSSLWLRQSHPPSQSISSMQVQVACGSLRHRICSASKYSLSRDPLHHSCTIHLRSTASRSSPISQAFHESPLSGQDLRFEARSLLA